MDARRQVKLLGLIVIGITNALGIPESCYSGLAGSHIELDGKLCSTFIAAGLKTACAKAEIAGYTTYTCIASTTCSNPLLKAVCCYTDNCNKPGTDFGTDPMSTGSSGSDNTGGGAGNNAGGTGADECYQCSILSGQSTCSPVIENCRTSYSFVPTKCAVQTVNSDSYSVRTYGCVAEYLCGQSGGSIQGTTSISCCDGNKCNHPNTFGSAAKNKLSMMCAGLALVLLVVNL